MLFGRYDLLMTLGRGGFGVVHLAHDFKLQRTVALKVLSAGLNEEAVKRFAREAKITINLRHPNIIKVLDAQFDDDEAYIAMEYVSAESLADVLQQRRIELPETLSIMEQIAGALRYLHEQEILHRDIKPENILLSEEGKAILIDFNLGLDGDMTALTRTGFVVGTPGYMAPELWKGYPFTFSTDIYGLGLVMHRLLTNRVTPLSSSKDPQMRMPKLEPPSKVEPKLGRAFDDFIAWTTAADPDKRCSSMKDFIVRLPRLEETKSRDIIVPTVDEKREKTPSRLKFVPMFFFLSCCLLLLFSHSSQQKTVSPSQKATAHIARAKILEVPPRLLVGCRRIELRWKSKDKKLLRMEAAFSAKEKVKMSMSGYNRILMDVPNYSHKLDYKVFQDSSCVGKGNTLIGLRDRQDKESIPGILPWKRDFPPLAVGTTIVLPGSSQLFGLTIDHDLNGPKIRKLWTAELGSKHVSTDMVLDGSTILVVGRAASEPFVTAIDGGRTKWTLSLGKKNKVQRVRVIVAQKGVAICALQMENGALKLCVIDYRSEQKTVSPGPELTKCDAFVLGMTRETVYVATLFEGVVYLSTYSLQADKTKLKLLHLAKVFSPRERAYLLPPNVLDSVEVLADPSIVENKREAELSVTPLPNDQLALRGGGLVQFCTLREGKPANEGDPYELGCSALRRASRALPLADGRVAFVIVHRAGETNHTSKAIDLLTLSRVDLLIIDRSKAHIKSSVLDRAALLNPMGVVCNEASLHDGRWYVPALCQVFMIDERDGHLVSIIKSGWCPTAIVRLDDSLFIPHETGKLHAFDLIDDY